MTHGKRHRLPQGERALTPIIAGRFPGGIPFQPLPNNCIADFITHTAIAEIEPIHRWQTGLAQILEYWVLALQSLHPVLILVDDDSPAGRRFARRAETTIAPLPVRLMIWDPTRNAFTRSQPSDIPNSYPTGRPTNAAGQPWTAPEYLIRAYDNARLPFSCWRDTYDRRQASRPPAPGSP